MVLKIAFDEKWWIYDDIRRVVIDHVRNWDFDVTDEDGGNPGSAPFTFILREPPAKDHTVAPARSFSLHMADGKDVQILTDSATVFLMNDQGKTIERLCCCD